jgi:hypothetical protein
MGAIQVVSRLSGLKPIAGKVNTATEARLLHRHGSTPDRNR